MARRKPNPYIETLRKESIEKYGEGELVRWGGNLVLLRDKSTIDTTVLCPMGKSEIDMELLNDQWHCSHSYEVEGHHGGFVGGGHSTSKETLKYLKECKAKIGERKEDLDKVSSDLEVMIEKIETNNQNP